MLRGPRTRNESTYSVIEKAVCVFVDYMGQRPDAARIAMRESIQSDPVIVADLPYDPLSQQQLEAHRRDVLNITRRLLGISPDVPC